MYPRVSTTVSKLGKYIASVNLPAITTCRPDAPCKQYCYAQRGNFAFKNVKGSLQKNLNAYLESPTMFFKVIDMELSYIKYKFFRWHSSGDIVDLRYLNGMVEIAEKHPDTKFLCFTKKYELVNQFLDVKGKFPDNLTIVLSAWLDWEFDNPYNLPVAYVRFKGIDCHIPECAKRCIKFCGDCVNTDNSCWDLEYGECVLFDKH